MQDNLDVVFVHGLFSGPATWDSIGSLMARDSELSFASAYRFSYASPKIRFRPDRRIPALDDIADLLKAYLHDQKSSHSRLFLVAHSQGGLIIQRYLARMLTEGRGRDLARIQGIVLFACPNTGSEFALSLRRAWWQRHPQEQTLRPFNDLVTDTHRTVQNQIVNAAEVGSSSCRIPIWVYGGTEDNVVKRASAQSTFLHAAMLPGDHSRIIRAASSDDAVYQVLRTRLFETQAVYEAGRDSSRVKSSKALEVPPSTHLGDRARAQSFLRAFPPLAGWLRHLRVQDFFTVSGKVNRLLEEGMTRMTTNPIQYVDSDLRNAETSCLEAGGRLMQGMLDLLFADPRAASGAEDLEHPEDGWVLKLRVHQPSVDEMRLHGLRDEFFETYDVLVNLLNERDLIDHAQEQAPKGRILQEPPERKKEARLTARLEGYSGRYRLIVSNTGTSDILNVSVAFPSEASSFRLIDHDLPIDIMRPGDSVRLPVSVVMGGGKGIFDAEITGSLEGGGTVRFFSKISI
ncbi:alpha/beta fold hydrolase [Streptomyces sp. NPDC001634]|uniref:alpha/beta fold hydrolase n=1 Tax=Streptomyces sp. NPDC001634 TaxID=3154390 RepID=UPI00332BFAD5